MTLFEVALSWEELSPSQQHYIEAREDGAQEPDPAKEETLPELWQHQPGHTYVISGIQNDWPFLLKQGWIDADGPDGTKLDLMIGAGLGNPFMFASAERKGRTVYEHVDVRPFLAAWWDHLRERLDEPATAEAIH